MKNKSHVVSWVPLLGVTFVALRLMGYIDWEWWVVLAPLWVPLAVSLAVSSSSAQSSITT